MIHQDASDSVAAVIDAPPMSALTRRFVLHWGEMGGRWGVNRTVAQIHALLYIRARPMHAEEIAAELGVARSNVSNSLRELQGWKLIRVTHLLGDRREHFESQSDVWEMLRTIVRERRAREFDPTVSLLQSLMDDPKIGAEPAVVRQRVGAMLTLMQTLSRWTDEMLRLDSALLWRILKTGARVQRFLRGAASSDESHDS